MMPTRSFALALAAVLLHPPMISAQDSSGVVRTATFGNTEAALRGGSLGAVFAMTPGPGQSYNYMHVSSIRSGSAAEAAGLVVGDTIVAVDGRDVLAAPMFPVRIPGTRYVMRVRRGSEEVELVLIYPPPEQDPPGENPAAAPPSLIHRSRSTSPR